MERIFNFLNKSNVEGLPSCKPEPFKFPFDLIPEDFISFAKEDLAEFTEKSLINALSNIKRAIDCQVESLLYLFGFYRKAKKNNWSFPQKTEFLMKLNIIAPRILKKINSKRNELEHEFKKPGKENVEDFLDIATLFLGYTKPFFSRQYLSIDFEVPDVPIFGLNMELLSDKGVIRLKYYDPIDDKKMEISIDDENTYIKLLHYWIKSVLHH